MGPTDTSRADIDSVTPVAHGHTRQPIEITINAHGYRGPLVSNEAADAFPRTLADKLRAQAPDETVEVINAGTPGYSSSQGRRWYAAEFADIPYNWLLLSYINNDAWAQPHTDAELFQQANSSAAVRLATWTVAQSRFLQAVQGAYLKATPAKPAQHRVDLQQFVAN